MTQDSLVLVDELGKGTEVRAGAAIAAAVLEALDAAGCKARALAVPLLPGRTGGREKALGVARTH